MLTPSGLYGGQAPVQRSTLDDRAARADVYNSPGWKRLQEAQSRPRPMHQPKESLTSVIDLDAVSSFVLGDRVFHQKFGYGAVAGIEGDKLEVAFERAGTKHVVARFLKPAAEAGDDPPF